MKNQSDKMITLHETLTNIPLPNSSANLLTVIDEYANQRLDNFLLRELKGMPKSHIYKLLRKGEVRVNRKRMKPDYRLQSGDVIRVPPSLIDAFNGKWRISGGVGRRPANSTMQMLLNNVIYEDNGLIVLNKPSGMAAHGGSGINFGVIEALRCARSDCKALELVHRLDRETSGCLLIAKKRSMLRTLHELLREHRVHKIYTLLVRGQWQGGAKKVDIPLLKNQLSSGERVVEVVADTTKKVAVQTRAEIKTSAGARAEGGAGVGKRAITVFRLLQPFSYQGTPLSLLEAELHTGRTHQIRVHAAHLGFPLACDDKYGDANFNKMLHHLGLQRLFLHASAIRFRLPTVTTPLHFVAPLPDNLSALLAKLAIDNREHTKV